MKIPESQNGPLRDSVARDHEVRQDRDVRRERVGDDRVKIGLSASRKFRTAQIAPSVLSFRTGQPLKCTTRSKEQISAQMRRIRKTDTRPELLVRKLAHRLGHRFRLHRRDLPGTPDLVFPSKRKIILVHGCFWHQHDCSLGRRQPQSNRDYWLPKLARNVVRDKSVQRELACLGWAVLVVWECETRDPLRSTKSR
ncbi:very short patch repair endonuclease [Bradyrhizobium sp. WSM1743]|uniref:very short patch repair endonuclease n=1 Tax=Bradyrhizobium sp. WSM1743 TaxID=318996 RepID=UPI0009FBC00D|nr:very short patch repair endonuclease [Bradyrhizobium sp. WSM1743]